MLLTSSAVEYKLLGSLQNPLVIVLGGISAGRDVDVWWRDFVGTNSAIDPDHFAIVGIDFLAHEKVTTYDQARAIKELLDELDVERAAAFVGSSYGGMVALAFGELFPERVSQLLVISAAHEPHPMATALRALQRRTIKLGIETGRTDEGISIARGIAMTTYRTTAEFAQRFDARADESGTFAVEEYLQHCGEAYARAFSPSRLLALSESIDLHAVDAANVLVPTTLVSVDTDTLVPPWQMQQTHALLPKSRLVSITSLYGHDAFLKETNTIGTIVREVLGESL